MVFTYLLFFFYTWKNQTKKAIKWTTWVWPFTLIFLIMTAVLRITHESHYQTWCILYTQTSIYIYIIYSYGYRYTPVHCSLLIYLLWYLMCIYLYMFEYVSMSSNRLNGLMIHMFIYKINAINHEQNCHWINLSSHQNQLTNERLFLFISFLYK